jgi:tRNA A-37 threonylcarbamoyl transferase component Bud32
VRRIAARALQWIGFALCLPGLPAWSLPPERQGTSLIREAGAELGGWPHHLSVTALTVDAAGRIWLGTPRGVWRFDGARLLAVGDWTGVDSEIADLEVTQAGRVFTLTTRGTLLEWLDGAWHARSSGQPLRELARDGDGGLVVAGGRTVMKLFPGDRLDVHPALAGRAGWAMDIKLRHGRLWLLWGPSLEALAVHSVGPDGVLQQDAQFDFGARPNEARRFDIASDGSRALWAGGLRVRRPDGEVLTPPIVPDGESAEYLRQLWFDRDGVLNVCGSAPVALTRWSADLAIDAFGDHLPHPTCYGLVEDPAGALWVGTYRGPMRLSAGPVWQRWLNPGQPSNGQAYALAAAQDGGYWVGAANGIHRLAASGRHISHFEMPVTVRALAEATSGEVYASSGSGLMVRVAGAWKHLPGGADDATVVSLGADPDGALWVIRDNGVERQVAGRVQARIPLAAPSMMLVTRDGRRLVAADALYELLPTNQGEWSAQPLARPASASVRLRSLFEAPDGAIWAATNGDGLWRWTATGLSRIGAKDGLPGDRFEWVVVAGTGGGALVYAAPRVASIFAGVPLVVFPVSSLDALPRTISWRQIGRQHGIIGPPLSSDVQPAAAVDADGRIWAAGAEGLAIIEPRTWDDWSRIDLPEAVIWQQHRRVEPETNGDFDLARDDSVFIELSTAHLPDTRLALWYRLDALPWQRAAAPASLELLALTPGAHALALQWRRDEGLHGAVRTLRLWVPEHWYERPVARLALILLACAGLLSAVVVRRHAVAQQREYDADLGAELAWLGRFQRMVLACVVQRMGSDPESLERALRPHMQSADAQDQIRAALAELGGRRLVSTGPDGRWLAARQGLNRQPVGTWPLEKLLRDGARRIEQYTLLDPLGSGGQANVWSAVDARTQAVVALKLLRGDHLMSAEMRERLRREADVLARLRHPGIVRLLRVVEVGDEQFIAMELVVGHSLAQVLKERRVLPLAEARLLLQRLRAAIEALHAEGIVHRDLNPANIMIRPNGEPVLIDFGLALRVQGGERVTRPFDHVGTLAYSAPERINPDTEYSADGPEVDWWSFGVIAHEVLLGLSPFKIDGLAPSDISMAFLHPDGPARRWIPQDLAPEWRNLIDSCLQQAPGDRQPDFAALEAGG